MTTATGAAQLEGHETVDEMTETREVIHSPELAPKTYLCDRRSAQRYRCSRQRFVRLISRPNLRSYHASIEDFSMRGLGIILEQAFEPGTIIALQLRSAHSGLSGLLSAEVRRSTQRADGRWLVGCSLAQRLTEDEALALL